MLIRTYLPVLLCLAQAVASGAAQGQPGSAQSVLTDDAVRKAFSQPTHESSPPASMRLDVTPEMLLNKDLRGVEMPASSAFPRMPSSAIAGWQLPANIKAAVQSRTPVQAAASAATGSSCNADSCTITAEFASGSATLSDQALADLAVIVRNLRRELKPIALRIEGHADTVGPWDANWQLSEARAFAAARFVVEQTGIDISQVQIYPLGKDPRFLVVRTGDQTPEPRNRCVRIMRVASGG